MTLLVAFFSGCVYTGDVTLSSTSAQAMLIEATGRLATAIEARNNLAVHVHYLAFSIDS